MHYLRAVTLQASSFTKWPLIRRVKKNSSNLFIFGLSYFPFFMNQTKLLLISFSVNLIAMQQSKSTQILFIPLGSLNFIFSKSPVILSAHPLPPPPFLPSLLSVQCFERSKPRLIIIDQLTWLGEQWVPSMGCNSAAIEMTRSVEISVRRRIISLSREIGFSIVFTWWPKLSSLSSAYRALRVDGWLQVKNLLTRIFSLLLMAFFSYESSFNPIYRFSRRWLPTKNYRRSEYVNRHLSVSRA